MESQGPKIAKTIFKNKYKVVCLTLSDFKTYCKTTVIISCGRGIKTEVKTNGTEDRAQNLEDMLSNLSYLGKKKSPI